MRLLRIWPVAASSPQGIPYLVFSLPSLACASGNSPSSPAIAQSVGNNDGCCVSFDGRNDDRCSARHIDNRENWRNQKRYD